MSTERKEEEEEEEEGRREIRVMAPTLGGRERSKRTFCFRGTAIYASQREEERSKTVKDGKRKGERWI